MIYTNIQQGSTLITIINWFVINLIEFYTAHHISCSVELIKHSSLVNHGSKSAFQVVEHHKLALNHKESVTFIIKNQ